MKTLHDQRQKCFFDPSPDRQHKHLAARPTDDEIRVMLAENNANCPLNKIVVSDKNEGGMHVLRLFAFTAYRDYRRSCRGMNFGIYTGPGQGKTHVVRCFAETIGTPFVFIQSDALQSTWHLWLEMKKVYAAYGTPLVPQYNEHHFAVPPGIVFFDEAHALSKDLRTGGLLNAMELNDGWLATNPPGKKQQATYKIDCRQLCWIAATTDPGVLFKQSQAFYDRFTNHIIWHNAGPREIALIVKRNFPHFPQEACDLVAHYCKVPRKSIAFANQMDMQRAYNIESWTEAAERVAEINGIDQFGMLNKQIDVLRALGQRPIAQRNLTIPAKCRAEELEKMILPDLIEDVPGRGPLIQITSRGYALTRAGTAELDKRGIAHNGDDILAESM